MILKNKASGLDYLRRIAGSDNYIEMSECTENENG